MAKEEISFILGFVRGGAIFMGAGEFSFEIDYEGQRVLARFWLSSDVSIAAFATDSCENGAIVLAG